MKRHKHNLSHFVLFTGNMGQLIPCGCTEVLPGDTFRHYSRVMVRVSPLAKPLMHPVNVRIHHFFVPYRILWDNWETFITDDESGLATPHVELVQAGVADLQKCRLAQYFGYGVDETSTVDQDMDAFPFRAYDMIYNEFFRDQDIDPEVFISKADGLDSEPYQFRRIRWEKDFFTQLRPSPQHGSESFATIDAGPPATLDMNEWRRAMSFQKVREHRNRFGSRYTDYLRFLGITPSDARLQRPEYLGGGKQTISFSEVLSTAEGTATNVGEMFGHGISAMSHRPYRRFFQEHGVVMSMFSVRPKSMYMQARHPNLEGMRVWSNFWQKEQEMLGEEVRSVKTVFVDGGGSAFGFGERHDQYRRKFSYVAGRFRDVESDWHMAREFSAAPVLNSSFVGCVPTDRVYLDANDAELKCMLYNNIRARRLVSRHGRN